MTAVRFLAVPLAALGLLVFTAPGCGSSDDPATFGSSSGSNRDGGASSGGDGDTICLLNNCDIDRDCADCSDGATVCDQSEHRCVACGSLANGKSCTSGQTCTKYGSCVSNGTACAEDASGTPTITCKNTADCGACGPKFRVCDTGSGKCVGCSTTNTTNCQSTDSCDATGTCKAKCPTSCATDGDCGKCGSTASPAHACNAHVCSACSATSPCANGDKCDLTHGTCIKQCGLGRAGSNNCSADGNCAGCTGTTKCDLPVNGGDGTPDGTCAVPATGCSDIAKNVFVLPAPFDKYTNLCSSDTDCANQQISLDVGKILKDATGLSAIGSGNIDYAEHACADVSILGKTCGVCVPCKTDTDCTDIDITKVAGNIFGPLGSVGASLLLDKAFGPNDHKVHMYCQNIAGNYGACLPCSNILSRCAQTADTVPTTGKCDHDICKAGDALNPVGDGCTTNSTCISSVCAKDPYCCVKEWDAQCAIDVDLYCTDKTCTPDTCAYRTAGWYCRSDPTQGAYRCDGDGTSSSTSIAEGLQCPSQPAATKCTTAQTGPKQPATLCDANTDTTLCPGGIGKPECVTN